MRWQLTTAATALNPVVGDLMLTEVGGDLAWFAASEADLETVQRLNTRFGLFRGEWFADKRVGVPWYQRILGNKNVSDSAKRAIFARVIRTCPGIAALESITLTYPATRTLQVNFKARLISGFLLDSAKIPPMVFKI